MSPEMAVRVSRATRPSPETGFFMQAKLGLWIAEQKHPKVEEFGEAAIKGVKSIVIGCLFPMRF